MAIDNKFYVYVWYKDGEPVYVGKGCGKRAYREKEAYDVEIYKNNLTEEQAYDLEKKLIAEFGRADKGDGPLMNLTDGGGLAFHTLFWKGEEIKKRFDEGIKRRSEREGWKEEQADRARHAAKVRAANWQDSIYLVKDPKGDIHKLTTQELKQYCKDNKLSRYSMMDKARGVTSRGGSTKDYEVECIYNKVTGLTQDESEVRAKLTSQI